MLCMQRGQGMRGHGHGASAQTGLTELEGAGAIVLESNHDIGLLQAGKYPQF